jgi:hypothetical protein
MCDYLDRVRVQVVIRDCFGRCVEDRRDVILRLDVVRDGRRIGDQDCHIAFEDLAS